jgi:hypothetical protein
MLWSETVRLTLNINHSLCNGRSSKNSISYCQFSQFLFPNNLNIKPLRIL